MLRNVNSFPRGILFSTDQQDFSKSMRVVSVNLREFVIYKLFFLDGHTPDSAPIRRANHHKIPCIIKSDENIFCID